MASIVTSQFIKQHSGLEYNKGTIEQQLKATDIIAQVVTSTPGNCETLWSKVDHDLMMGRLVMYLIEQESALGNSKSTMEVLETKTEFADYNEQTGSDLRGVLSPMNFVGIQTQF